MIAVRAHCNPLDIYIYIYKTEMFVHLSVCPSRFGGGLPRETGRVDRMEGANGEGAAEGDGEGGQEGGGKIMAMGGNGREISRPRETGRMDRKEGGNGEGGL